MPSTVEPVYLELGRRRVFVCSLNWPGWARSGKSVDDALATLAGAAPRYGIVASEAGIPFPARDGSTFDVVERLPGSGGTDFGAPMAIPGVDGAPIDRSEARRLASLVAAAWTTLDQVVATAPAELRKGPRGGGRDRDKIAGHVLAAEVEYARKLGLRLRQPPYDDPAAVSAFREAILAALAGESTNRGSAGSKNPPWPVPYAARRIAWHTLDHAWEIEDRSA
jgi:hypothetical protein